MLRGILIDTGFSETEIEALMNREQSSTNDYLLSQIEIALRSDLFMSRGVGRIDAALAIGAIRHESQVINFIHYYDAAVSSENHEYKEACKHLKLAYKKRGKVLNLRAQSALGLAQIYKHLDKPTKAMAWLLEAVCQGSISAKEIFFQHRFFQLNNLNIENPENKNSIDALLATAYTAFAIFLLKGKRIAEEKIDLYNDFSRLGKKFVSYFKAGNATDLTDPLVENSPVIKLMKLALSHHPKAYYQLILFCYKKSIINEDIFIRMGHCLLDNIWQEDLCSIVNNNLLKLYVCRTNWDKAFLCLSKPEMVSADIDLDILKEITDTKISDKFYYHLFKIFAIRNDFSHALECLNALSFKFIGYDLALKRFFRSHYSIQMKYEDFRLCRNFTEKFMLAHVENRKDYREEERVDLKIHDHIIELHHHFHHPENIMANTLQHIIRIFRSIELWMEIDPTTPHSYVSLLPGFSVDINYFETIFSSRDERSILADNDTPEKLLSDFQLRIIDKYKESIGTKFRKQFEYCIELFNLVKSDFDMESVQVLDEFKPTESVRMKSYLGSITKFFEPRRQSFDIKIRDDEDEEVALLSSSK